MSCASCSGRRSRVLSRHRPLSRLLVSSRISRALSGCVCDRRAGFHRDRRAGLRPPARARRPDGAEKAGNGCSSSRACHRCCSASSPGSISPTSLTRELADLGAEGMARRKAQRRDRCQTGRDAFNARRGAVIAKSDRALAGLFRLRRRAQWHAVLAAADRQGLRPHQRADRLRHRDPYLFGTIAMIL
jgi:hypothetical protein